MLDPDALETASIDGWKLFIACADGSFFPTNVIRDVCSSCLADGLNLYDTLYKYVSTSPFSPERHPFMRDDLSRLILPFFLSNGLSNTSLRMYYKNNLRIMNGSDRTFRFIQEFSIPFLMSSLYEHYVCEACEVLNFPIENAYSMSLDLDYWEISNDERETLMQISNEISNMTSLRSCKCDNSDELPDDAKNELERLDEIFKIDIAHLQSYRALSSSTVLGQEEKVSALLDVRRKTGFDLEDTFFIGSVSSDSLISHIVKNAGGLTIAFNAHPATICSSDLAVVSGDTTVLSFLADLFQNSGKEYVLDLVENWNKDTIESSPANIYLKNELLKLSEDKLPFVIRVDSEKIPESLMETQTDTSDKQ